MFKKEVKSVTYNHPVDSRHGETREIPVVPPQSTKSAEAAGTPSLKFGYNVGKKPETKSIQSTK